LIYYLKTNIWLAAAIAFLSLGALGAGLKYLDEAARREIAKRAASKDSPAAQEESFLNRVNPFLPTFTPTPSPTPLPLSKEYVYAGSRLLAVEDANASAIPPADLAIWRPSNGQWWVMSGTGTQQMTQSWGQSGDKPVPGDYDSDGKTDFAVFRPVYSVSPAVDHGTWYIAGSIGGGQLDFGLSTDKPVPADYDGDGRTDIAVWRKSNATWYIVYSSTNTVVYGSLAATPTSTDDAAPADYDGDGRADLSIFTGSAFHILKSSNLQETSTTFGAGGDKPVPADFDGDGKADIALWRGGSTGTWYILQSSNSQTATVSFGIGTDTPVHNDYDGDGKVDIALWRGTASGAGNDVGKWYIINSSNPSNVREETWGGAGDIPVPALWKR
jgi:hypothetical protein